MSCREISLEKLLPLCDFNPEVIEDEESIPAVDLYDFALKMGVQNLATWEKIYLDS